jgi:hypothetical protein
MTKLVFVLNILCVLLGIAAVVAVFYLSVYTDAFRTGNKFDDRYGLFGSLLASVGFLVGSIYWFKWRVENNV